MNKYDEMIKKIINEICLDCASHDGICDNEINCDEVCRYRLAIQALKEKQEREKGCEYCNIGEHKDTLYKISTIGNPTFKLFEPNFCPMCGRKLGEKHE